MLAYSMTEQLPVAPGENRVALRGLDWVAYKQMKALLNERTKARLTFDCGTLEITTTSQTHEFYGIFQNSRGSH